MNIKRTLERRLSNSQRCSRLSASDLADSIETMLLGWECCNEIPARCHFQKKSAQAPRSPSVHNLGNGLTPFVKSERPSGRTSSRRRHANGTALRISQSFRGPQRTRPYAFAYSSASFARSGRRIEVRSPFSATSPPRHSRFPLPMIAIFANFKGQL